jgi:hypothetical protein
LAKEGLVDETHQNGAGQSNLAGLDANQDVPQMPPLPISGPMPEGLLSSPGLTAGISPGLSPSVATIAASTPSHELQPLGQSSAKGGGLDAATWAGQSLVVAVVLGGVALVAYAIKRRQLAKGGVPAAREGAQMDRAIDLETVDEDRAEHAAPAGFGYAGMTGGMGGGMGDALRDEIATLRAEIESARDEAAQLRREVASLRTMMERGIERGNERGNERGALLRDGRSPGTKHDQMFATDSMRGEASHTMDQPHAEPKSAMRESVEQRVLALAARGETAIAIAQRTGVPTGQVELMINLARASGRV